MTGECRLHQRIARLRGGDHFSDLFVDMRGKGACCVHGGGESFALRARRAGNQVLLSWTRLDLIQDKIILQIFSGTGV
jgi:hypothetical protein